ncbi:hypothetical protein GCM10027343_31390 [Noviherbaspirillum agri]
MIKSSIAGFLLAAVTVANAHAAPPAQSGQAAASPAKKELANKIVELMHIENLGVSMLQEPVAKAMGQARVTLQARAPAERHEAALRDIAEDAKKFLDEAAPIVKGSAQKHIPATVIPLLAERFTEDELRQIIAMLESPVKKKFEAIVPDIQKSLGEKIASDTRATIDPKMEGLTQRIGMRLRTAVTP